MASHPLLTIGHGASGREELSRRLHDAGITTLVDVRRFPGSRRNPEVGRDELEVWLPAEGIEYVWEERLGGRRRLPTGSADLDGWWQVEAFRAYAAHVRTPEFAAALGGVLDRVDSSVVAVMCSENVWWRCHRRLVADAAMLLHDVPVTHVMPDGRRSPHQPSPGAKVSPDGVLTYPADPL